jgi:hypothetical protein
MAAPAYATDLTDIVVPPMNTGDWGAFGGGASGLNAETDYYLIDSDCLSKNAWASDYKGMVYDNVTDVTVAAGDGVFVWLTHLTPNSLATEAAGGLRIVCADANTESTFDEWYVGGSDTIVYDDRWLCAVAEIGAVTPDANNGATAPYSWFGAGANLPTGGPTKGSPFAINSIRHGREFQCTDGDLANGYATFDGAATFDNASTRRAGLITFSKGVYTLQGAFVMGTATTAVDFRDANRTLFIARTPKVSAGFNGFEVRNASSRVDWTDISCQALGTTSKGYFEVVDAADVNLLRVTFVDMALFTFTSTTDAIDCTFRGCDQITAPGSNLSGTAVSGYTGITTLGGTATANTSAVIWNVNDSGSGKLDGMSFTMGSTATHAIEFGLTSPTTINLNDIDFSGYGASNNANDSMLHIKRTSGTVTINLSGVTIDGGAGTVTYRTDGATVSLVNSTSLTVTGLQNPSEVRVYDAGTTTEIAGQEDVTTGTYTTSIDAATYPSVDISILSLGYQNKRFLEVSMATDQSIPASQVIDRQYLNPSAPATTVSLDDTQTATSTTGTATVTMNSTEGNLQVLYAVHRTATATVSNPTGSGWSTARLVETQIGDTNNRRAISMWWREVPASANTSITAGFNVTTNVVVSCREFAPSAAGAWAVGGTTGVGDNGTTAGTSVSTSSVTPTGGDHQVITSGAVWRHGDISAITVSNLSGAPASNSTGAGVNELTGAITHEINPGAARVANWAWTTSAIMTGISDWFTYTET